MSREEHERKLVIAQKAVTAVAEALSDDELALLDELNDYTDGEALIDGIREIVMGRHPELFGAAGHHDEKKEKA